MDRRKFLVSSANVSVGVSLHQRARGLIREFPVTSAVPLTQGPGYHWFGYYDKLQTDPAGRYVLGMKTEFEGCSPRKDDSIVVGMVDMKDGNRWTDLGISRAWGGQQGCMLQWIPGSRREIIWNDLEGGEYVSHVLNIKTGKKRTLPKPVYALSPDGNWAIGTEFSRIDGLRPGYGYAGIPDPFESVKAPREIGLYRMNLQSGETRLLFSLADLASIPHLGNSVEDNFHWFNHLLVNTDGTRFSFLHRWRKERTDRQTMAASVL